MNASPHWRIAIIGAGAIGSAIGVRLASAGHEVTLVIRNDLRRHQISTHGLIGKPLNGTVERFDVRYTASLDQEYDLVVVPVQRQQLDDVIPILAANKSTRIMLALNNAAGTRSIGEKIGAERVIWGFPAIVASVKDGVVEYNVVPSYVQKTTFGRTDGRVTEDLRTIKNIFEESGVPSVITIQIDGWLKTHAAVLAPVVAAAFLPRRSGFGPLLGWSSAHRLASGIQTGLQAIKKTGGAITPGSLRALELLPNAVLTANIVAGFSTPPVKDLATNTLSSGAAESALLLAQLAVLAREAGIDPAPLTDLASVIPNNNHR